jgi:hypothetical protein
MVEVCRRRLRHGTEGFAGKLVVLLAQLVKLLLQPDKALLAALGRAVPPWWSANLYPPTSRSCLKLHSWAVPERVPPEPSSKKSTIRQGAG